MASVSSQMPLPLPPAGGDFQHTLELDDIQTLKDTSSESEDGENIPYHARENARPFTYGNLPEGFTTSELNHVELEDLQESPKAMTRTQAVMPPSPTTLRKSTRPSISPSRPVLRKTPTRQEFEEMLQERREQALREQNTVATKMAQNAAIQKDLDELQEILNKKVVQAEKDKLALERQVTNVVKHVESVDLPDAVVGVKNSVKFKAIESDVPKAGVPFEPTLLIAEPKRSITPTFPVPPIGALDERCTSPYPMVTPGTPTLQRINPVPVKEKSAGERKDIAKKPANYNLPPAISQSSEPQMVEPHLVKFAKDCSDYWYKPHITREEAVALLRQAPPGTFIIRNSNTYKNAFGLVLRVAKAPAGVIVADNSSGDELVRHFLLEPTARGVRLKGCANEPVFTSLSAFVYQHSINPLALPCKLIIPDRDLLQSSGDAELIAAQRQLLQQGAACNVLYLFTCDMESLTGDEAVRKAVDALYGQHQLSKAVEVHFKVSQQGITLTDNTRSRFFRRHYTPMNISHFSIDPEQRFWNVVAQDEGLERAVKKSIFAFVARPTAAARDNQCHVFCDLAANQPAAAIVSFANKVLPMDKQHHKMI